MKGSIRKNWDSILQLFPNDFFDVYFEEKYYKLYETEENKAVCFIYTEDKYIFLFPFLRREFTHNGKLFYDFETAYGYGGPIYNNNNEQFATRALKAMYDYCSKSNYIAGFVRFHPLLNNHKFYSTIGELILDRNTIAIDLTLSKEDIWMNEIHTKNRSTIKKAVKSGLEFIIDKEYNYLNEFIKLYENTMKRLNADTFYSFNHNYYSMFRDTIKNSFLGVVLSDNKLISAAIFFHSKDYGHYHLSASDPKFLNMNPNNFLLYEGSKVMKALGIKKFHLGGGINSDEQNSLFRFKRKFSKRKYNFYIGKTIFNKEIYDLLCEDWVLMNPSKQEIYKKHLLKYKF